MEVISGKERAFFLIDVAKYSMKMNPDIATVFKLLMPIATHAEAKVEGEEVLGIVLYFDGEQNLMYEKYIEWNAELGLVGRTESLLLTVIRAMARDCEKQMFIKGEEIRRLLQNYSFPIIYKTLEEK